MIPSTMKSPGDIRPGIWRGRVLQVKVLNACDLDCRNCSVAVGIAKKTKRLFLMTPDQFREALRSLKGFPGVIGMFGGNPCIHPDFEELCKIFREEIPNKEQRGLWSNRLFGHGKVCRETFHGPHSNLNVHQVQAAWDEIKRDWPEGRAMAAGLSEPSTHGPIFGSPTDIGVDEKTMWEKIGACYVNQTWSAEITVVDGQLLGYFCEIAATMAELENDPSAGCDVYPGWWRKGMPEFTEQVHRYCTRCLIPLNPKKIDAASKDEEQYTAVWKPFMMTVKGRPLGEIKSYKEIEGGSPATKYLPRGVMVGG
jgi:radical SAM family protein